MGKLTTRLQRLLAELAQKEMLENQRHDDVLADIAKRRIAIQKASLAASEDFERTLDILIQTGVINANL